MDVSQSAADGCHGFVGLAVGKAARHVCVATVTRFSFGPDLLCSTSFSVTDEAESNKLDFKSSWSRVNQAVDFELIDSLSTLQGSRIGKIWFIIPVDPSGEALILNRFLLIGI